MLKLDHVSFQYADTSILKNISHTFTDGAVTAVTGASGSGKTTLLHLLAGLQRPTMGSIQNTYAKTAVAFQEPRLFPWMTALENITVVCKDKEIARSYLNVLFSESDVERKYPDELSGGMKQRISLARALAFEPDLLLLDEPFRGLDTETKRKTATFLFEKMREKTCILITHDEEDLPYCDEHLHLWGAPDFTLSSEKLGKVEN